MCTLILTQFNFYLGWSAVWADTNQVQDSIPSKFCYSPTTRSLKLFPVNVKKLQQHLLIGGPTCFLFV